MSEPKPVAAQFCATFLKPEMLHIYRQITGLQRYQPAVWTYKRENSADFPFDPVEQIRRPLTREIRRIWMRQILGRPVQIYRAEARRLARTLRARHARVLHIYFGHIAVQLLPFIEMRALPTVVSFHGADVMVDLEKKSYRAAAERMLAQVDLVLVRSQSLADRLLDLDCAQEKIRIQRTGLPLDAFPFAPRDLPADGSWHFVQACRLIPKKGLSVSLRAFAGFTKEHPHARLTIAGDGPDLPDLQALAAELGLAGRVEFPGFLRQSDLRALYERAHIFLHPSETGVDGNQEGVPNSMLEAMASGLPVLATRHGGIPEAVDDGMSGFLVAEGDHEALADAMRRLTASATRLPAMGKAAHDAVAERFEQRAQNARLEEFYDEAILRSNARAQLA